MICDICKRNVKKAISADNKIIYPCHCSNIIKGDDMSVFISGTMGNVADKISMLGTFIRYASQDPTNMIVKRKCDNCYRDYMTMLDIDGKIIYICKCNIEASVKNEHSESAARVDQAEVAEAT